jgi:hypothetical protein
VLLDVPSRYDCGARFSRARLGDGIVRLVTLTASGQRHQWTSHIPEPEERVALQPDGQPVRTPLLVPLHVITQPPPAQVASQFPVFEQTISQPPPAQENTQFPAPEQVSVQPPPGQS